MKPSSNASVIDLKVSTSRARVLIFTGQFPPEIGGAGRVPQAIAAAFPDRVAVVAQKPATGQNSTADLARFDAQFSFKTFRISAFAGRVRWWPGKIRGLLTLLYNWLWVRPKAWIELRRLLASHPFDVACFNTIGPCYWLPRWLRRLNPDVKVVVYSHGEEWANNMNSSDWGRRAFRTIAKADAVVAVSSFTRECAITQGVSAERVHVVNNGVDLSRFSPGPPQPQLLDRWNLRNRPTILCVARFDERKGQDTLIRAMPEILQRIPDAALLLVGGGPDGPRLFALVEDLHLESSVIFTGTVSDDEVVGWYRTANIYCMPNRVTKNGDTEGFGLVFLEAGACGLPVIGGRAGGVVDAIVAGETGLLVDGRSHSEVAEACIRLLLDPDLRARMARNGIQHAAQNSWDQKAAEFLRVCDSTLDSTGPNSR